MSTDLFKFWALLPRGQTIHPADREVFDRIDKRRHGFRLECLPGNFGGPLRTAPVVLLFLSPGFTKFDLKDAKDPEGRRYHLRRLAGREPLPTDERRPGVVWVKSRTKSFGGYEKVRHNVAIYNIGAYHSTTFNDYSMLAALPSSRVALDWAQSVLFPEAEAEKRIVICMRSASYWGLETGKRYRGTLFAPHVTRSGYLRDGSETKRIKRLVRERLQNADPVLACR